MVSVDQAIVFMADDDKKKAKSNQSSAENEHKKMMAALLKKFDVMSALEDVWIATGAARNR